MKLKHLNYINENLPKYFSPYHIYAILVENIQVGTLIVREGSIEDNYYDGHIGYTIDDEYRGHHYAYQACLLIKDDLIKQGVNKVIITCSPENIASKKTILKLKANYLETKKIPKHLLKYYMPGENIKEIYEWELTK